LSAPSVRGPKPAERAGARRRPPGAAAHLSANSRVRELMSIA